MPNAKALLEMSQTELDRVDPSALAELEAVTMGEGLSHEEKLLSYIEQLGNPYCFKSGGVAVRVRFAEEGGSLSQLLARYFSRLKQG